MSHSQTDGLADLVLWRTFLAVHRSGSISAAARALGLAQPSVTVQLQTLETRIGERLFERHARGVLPTPRADDLAERLAGPFGALAEAVTAATGAEGVDAPVRLGGPAEFLAEVALPAVAPLVSRGLALRVTAGLTDGLLADLREGRLDVAVSTHRPKGRSLLARPLADEEFVLVGAPGAAVTHVRSAADLTGVPLVAYAADVPILRRYWRHVFGTRLDDTPSVTVPDLRAVRAAVAAGAGISVLPRYLVQQMLDDGRLLQLLTTDDPPINTTFVVTRPATSASVGAVVDVLLDATRGWR